MNKQGLLILGLLYGLAACMTFKWVKTDYYTTQEPLTHITHQSTTDGRMHVMYRYRDSYYKVIYLIINREGSVRTISTISQYYVELELGSVASQVSDSSERVMFAFFGCYNKPLFHLFGKSPRDCANVYFLESLNGGDKWSSVVQVSASEVYIPPESSISLVLERDTERVYLFHSIKTSEDAELYSRVVAYVREPNEKEFKLVYTFPSLRKLQSFSALVSKNTDDATRYVHLIMTTSDAVLYSRSNDKAKTWSSFHTIVQGTAPYYYNYVAYDPGAYTDSFYILYKLSDSKKVYVTLTHNHGKTFEKPILVGDSLRQNHDAIGFCGSDYFEESVVVISHIDYDIENSYVKVMIDDKVQLLDLPYPFANIQGIPMVNLMIDCSSRGLREYYITFYMLARGNAERIYFAFGILNLT